MKSFCEKLESTIFPHLLWKRGVLKFLTVLNDWESTKPHLRSGLATTQDIKTDFESAATT